MIFMTFTNELISVFIAHHTHKHPHSHPPPTESASSAEGVWLQLGRTLESFLFAEMYVVTILTALT